MDGKISKKKVKGRSFPKNGFDSLPPPPPPRRVELSCGGFEFSSPINRNANGKVKYRKLFAFAASFAAVVLSCVHLGKMWNGRCDGCNLGTGWTAELD